MIRIEKGASDFILIKDIVNNVNIKRVNFYELMVKLSKYYQNTKEELAKDREWIAGELKRKTQFDQKD